MTKNNDINERIMAITTKIQSKHPELLELLNEMPVTIPDEDNPRISGILLEEYYESLENILKNFSPILPAHPRPDQNRFLDAPVIQIDLLGVIERLKQEVDWINGKQQSITIAKTKDLGLVLVALHEANEINMKEAKGTISLQVIQGKIKCGSDTDSLILSNNQILILTNSRQELTAIEESVVLLTIASDSRISL